MTSIQLREDESTDMIFWSHTMPMARMYADIEHNGVFLDLKKLDKAQIFWSKREAKFLKKLNSYLPNDWEWKDKKTKSMQPGINWESPKQIGEAFEELGIKSLGKTKTGQAKTDVATLKTLSRKHKVCKTILDYREATKTLNTFIESWQEKNINGYIHPTFKVHGTVTGRPSCEKPNLQQTKRDPRIRSIITAPPGWTFIEADYSQAELRIMAEMSDDPELTLAFVNGLDVHILTCQRILGIKNPTKDERKKAKAINFGFIYGMGCKTFIEKAWEKYGIRFSMVEAKKIKKGYFQLYRKVTTYHERQERFGRRNGYVRSILGRKRRLPALLEGGGGYNYFESVRQAINAPIQGFVSDLNLMSAIELHNKLDSKEFRIVGTVHDNILMFGRNDCLEKIIPKIVKTMEDPKLLRDLNIQLRIPLISDLSYGPWSKGKKWVPGEKIIIE